VKLLPEVALSPPRWALVLLRGSPVEEKALEEWVGPVEALVSLVVAVVP